MSRITWTILPLRATISLKRVNPGTGILGQGKLKGAVCVFVQLDGCCGYERRQAQAVTPVAVINAGRCLHVEAPLAEVVHRSAYRLYHAKELTGVVHL